MPNQPTFIIIGAQKAATTSLYHWLRQHPQIFLSGQKELDFFSETERYANGIDYYRRKWFANAGTAIAIGDVSPQYMLSAATPARIARDLPNVKLIAILRNPIDRAVSHHSMLRKWGVEQRSFGVAARELAKSGHALIEHTHTNPLVGGLYGAILGRYLELFPRRALCIEFYEDLIEQPQRRLQHILDFIGVDSAFVPDDIGDVYNRRATQRRFPAFEDWIMRRHVLKRAISAVVPPVLLSRFLFWFDTEFNVKRSEQDEEPALDAPLRQFLVDYFRPDVARLELLIGRPVPWPEFRTSEPQDRLKATS
jgi:hypothetical protein